MIFFLIVAPTLTLLHEMGHSIVPLAKGEQVYITIGGYEGSPIVLGKLSITYAGPLMPWVGYTKWTGNRDFARLALGPLVSLALVILCYWLISHSSSRHLSIFLKLILYWSIGAFVFTAFPFKYPTFMVKNPTDESDGKQIVEIVRTWL